MNPLTLSDEEVWLSIFNACASSSNCADIKSAVSWADNGLVELRKRFPQKENMINE